jgi:E3 ubiquitin-protein ligase SIAH1
MSDNVPLASDGVKTILIADVEELMECPCCLTLPDSPPIHQCSNGHLICKTCRVKLTNCPTCRQVLGDNRCLFAEKMLEKLSNPCPFAKHGCVAR